MMLDSGVIGRAALLFAVFGLLLPAAAATDVEITSLSTPSDIRAGEPAEMRVTLENAGDERITNATVTVEAWGQRTRSKRVSLDPGARKQVPVTLSVPLDASGQEEVRFEARAVGTSNVIDRAIRTVKVSVTELYMTIQVAPKQVAVGEQVTVSGQMSSRNVEATLTVGGRFEATVRSGNQGYYEHVFTPEESGTFTVRVQAGGTSASTLLDIRPRLAVKGMTVPRQVNTNQRFEVCADIVRSGTGPVTLDLISDDSVLQTRTITVQGERTVCFPHVLSEEGTHDLRLEASTGSVTATGRATIEAVPATVEVQVFPDTLTVKRGAAGLFEIAVTNNAAQTQHLTVAVEGMENVSTSLTRQDIRLETGDSGTVYLRVLPTDLGTYTGTVTVSRDGSFITEREITVRAASNPPLQHGALAEIGGHVGSAADVALQYGPPVLTVLVILLLLVFYRRHRRGRTALEPRR